MSTSRSADGQRNSLHPTGRPGTMRRPVPQRRASDCECRCRPRRCQWPGDLDTAHEHQSTQQSRLRNFAAAMVTCVQPGTPARRAYPRNSVAVNCNAAAGERPVVRREVHGAIATCTKCRTTNPDGSGIFNPNPASPDDGEGNRAVNHWRCEGWKLFTHA